MAPGRRSFLCRAATGGAALTIGSVVVPLGGLVGRAAAQEGDAPLADDDIAAFAESVELAAVEAYRAAAGSGKVTTPAVGEAATTFAGHHQEHAAAFGGAAGAKATKKANARLLQVVGDQIKQARDQAGVLKIAYDLENAAAATYVYALGALQSKEALQLTASILPVESQHAVVLGMALGRPLEDDVVPPFETQDQRVDPAQFPVEA
jgi:hypothetical protein